MNDFMNNLTSTQIFLGLASIHVLCAIMSDDPNRILGSGLSAVTLAIFGLCSTIVEVAKKSGILSKK